CLEVIVQTRQITPAGISAHLDQPCPEHQPEERPAIDPIERHLWRRVVRAGKDREEASLQEERLPAERIKRLAHVDEGEVQHPEECPDDAGGDPASMLYEAGERDEREQHADPACGAEGGVGWPEEEET